jgi:hypothetical protein
MHAARPVRAAIAAATIAGVLAGTIATTAAAATVERSVTHDIPLDITLGAASAACGFKVELHSVGMEVLISRYDNDGNLVSETRQIHYDGYILNPANGKTIMSKVSGPERYVYYADGSILGTSSGSTVRTAPGAGLVSGFIGHSSVTLVPTGEVDEDGFPIYDEVGGTFAGQFLGNDGICGILS